MYNNFVMKSFKTTLIRETIYFDTNQKEKEEYAGKLISKEVNKFSYAFKVDNEIMRLEMEFKDGMCFIKQSYPSTFIEFCLNLNQKEKYCLNLSSNHKLFFITETSLIKFDELEIKLKYNLYEESSNEIISSNEIRIIGDGEIC